MRETKHLLCLILFSLPSMALASKPVIYGEDNRLDVFEAKPLYQTWARSTATMFKVEDLKVVGEFTEVNQSTLAEEVAPSQKYCPEVRFVDQPSNGKCSGFLIAPDLLVTAGHCVASANFCEKNKWVFDYNYEPLSKTAGSKVSNENIYSCKRVVSKALLMIKDADYGVIQLDRKVVGRKPLAIRRSKKVSSTIPLVLIGAPSGLPIKIADGGTIRDNTQDFFFTANLDSFQGNSGSGVFDASTGVVEGILVRGETDYVTDVARNCLLPNVCAMGACSGEAVSRITTIPEIAIGPLFLKAVLEGNLKNLGEIIKLNLWLDFPDQSGQTVLMKAVSANASASVQILLAAGSDPQATDGEGNSVLHVFAKSFKGDLSIFDLLVKAGAKINAINARGETILFTLIRQGQVAVAQELIAKGLNPDIRNVKGQTAFEAGTEISLFSIAQPKSF